MLLLAWTTSVANGGSVTLDGPITWPGFNRGPAMRVSVVDTHSSFGTNAFAFIAAREGGLVIFDITDPKSPVRRGVFETTDWVLDVKVVGTTAYLACGAGGLKVVDVSNPASPTLLAAKTPALSNPSPDTRAVEVVGGLAYLADGEAGMRIIDLAMELATAPAQQIGLAPNAPGGYAQGIRVRGPYAYLADGYAGLLVLDVGDPKDPKQEGTYTPLVGEARDVDLDEDLTGEGLAQYAYLAADEGGLVMVNVASKTAPAQAGSLETEGPAFAVRVAGTNAYVAALDAGLEVIDVSQPAQASRLGVYDSPGLALGVAVWQTRVCLADYDGGLAIVNVSAPNAPTAEGRCSTFSEAQGIWVVGDNAYLAEGSTGLTVLTNASQTITNQPISLAGQTNSRGSSFAVQVAGNHAYVADATAGLTVVRLTETKSPVVVSRLPTAGVANGVFLDDHYAYVAVDTAGLQIFDITDGDRATAVSTNSLGTNAYNAYAVAVQRQPANGKKVYAFVAAGPGGVRVVDVTVPTAAVVLNPGMATSDARDIAVAGDYAYVADGDAGLKILEVKDPANPTTVASLDQASLEGSSDLRGFAYAVHVVGNFAYVADGAAGLRVVDVTAKQQPFLAGYYPLTNALALGVHIEGQRVYVAAGSRGLLALTSSALSNQSGPPTITTQPQGLTRIAPGSSATLSVNAAGAPPLVYQWSNLVSGAWVRILNATNATYQTPLLTATSAYRVQVANMHAAVPSQIATVQVPKPPVIVQQPETKKTNTYGSDASFTIVAVSEDPLAYRWRFNGQSIVGATNATLDLPNVRLASEGRYSVVVSNQAGSVTSNDAELVVLAQGVPPVWVPVSQEQIVKVAGTLTLRANAENTATPTNQYHWKLNGLFLEETVEPSSSSDLRAHGRITGTKTQTLTVTNFQVADAGSYTVVVANDAGMIESPVFRVRPDLPMLSYTDTSSGPRTNLTTANGAGTAYLPNGQSAWFTWVAPAKGLATFTTAGSGFDTLLAGYTNTAAPPMPPLTSDDDGGGFHTSYIRFGAERGKRYQLAVGRMGDAGGDVALSWNFQENVEPPPETITSPGTLAPLDAAIRFTNVVADPDASVQWFFSGGKLCEKCSAETTHGAGVTTSILRIGEIGPGQVGYYWTLISSRNKPTNYSEPQLLELLLTNTTSVADQQPLPSQDKLEDLLAALRARAAATLSGKRTTLHGLTGSNRPGLGLAGFQSVSAGTILSANHLSTTQLLESHCNVSGSKSRWFYLPVTTDGLVTVETTGSDFDTILAVYRGASTNLASLRTFQDLEPVGCDDNSAPDQRNGIVRFIGNREEYYFAAVEGRDDQAGTIQFGWSVDPAPPEDTFRWLALVSTSAQPQYALLDKSASNVKRVYQVYSGTDYGNMRNILFVDQTNEAWFQVLPGLSYVVLVDARDGNPDNIGEVWRLLDPPYPRTTLNGTSLKIAWRGTEFQLQVAPGAAGPWVDGQFPTQQQGGQVTALVQPGGSMRFFRVVPARR